MSRIAIKPKTRVCLHIWEPTLALGIERCRTCRTSRQVVVAKSSKKDAPAPLIAPEIVFLPSCFRAKLIPLPTELCEKCHLWAWARLPQMPAYIVCSDCHLPHTWFLLARELEPDPYAPPETPCGVGYTLYRQKERPKRPCAYGHDAWVRELPAFPGTWICQRCHPGRGQGKDFYYLPNAEAKLPHIQGY